MEKASGTRRGQSFGEVDIRQLREFKMHLAREGINYDTWAKRQRFNSAGPDQTSAALQLQARHNALRATGVTSK